MLGTSIAHTRSKEWKAATISALNPPAWMDWTFDHTDAENHLPVVFYLQEKPWNARAREMAIDCQKIWLLGNEPELATTFIAPKVAAEFTSTWHSARWGAPGVVLSDKGFLWLDEYRRSGGKIGTHLHVHVYEVNTPEDWAAKWWRLRGWMDRQGLAIPVVVSETCGWDASVDQRRIMDKIVYIQQIDKLLECVLWYSDADWWKSWKWADLRNDDGSLTSLGEYFVSLQKRRFNQFMPMVSAE